MSSSPQNHRFDYIDAMRGLAALFVVIYHSTRFHQSEAGYHLIPVALSDMPYASVLWPAYLYGEEAVRLFWVISGFVFAHVYWNRPTSAKGFAVARFARLYPLHLITLIIVAVLQIVSLQTQGHWQITENNDLRHFVLQIFLLDTSLSLSDGVSFNAPIWSVSAEIFVYILFFVTLAFTRARPILGAAMLALAAYGCLLLRPDGFIIGPMVFVCGVFFFAGAMCYGAFQRLNGQIAAVVWALLGMTGIAVVLQIPDAALLTGFATLVLGLAWLQSRLSIGRTAAAFLGDISYSLYLVHMPLQIAVLLVIDLAFGGGRAFAQSYWTLPIFIGASLCVAWATHVYFEKPIGAWIRRKLS